jgi:hypothetical protein
MPVDRDPFVEVLGPLQQLRGVVTERFARHGLQVVDFVVSPGSDVEGPHLVHVLAVPGGGEAPDDCDGREAFEAVIRSTHEAEQDRRHEQAREGLLDRLSKNDGFL